MQALTAVKGLKSMLGGIYLMKICAWIRLCQHFTCLSILDANYMSIICLGYTMDINITRLDMRKEGLRIN